MAQHTILFEIWYDGDWHTVPTYNRDEVVITRGRQDQLQTVSPTMCTLTINNRGGEYSPRNANSSLYGKIGPNTRCQLTIDGDVRFVGEVQSWPQRWTTGATDVWVPIAALGLLQRLGMPGQKALARSALFRAIPDSSPEFYWSLEDGGDATQAASGVGGSPMLVTGDVIFGQSEGLAGASQTVSLELSSRLRGALSGVSGESWFIEFDMKMDLDAAGPQPVFLVTNSTLFARYQFFSPLNAADGWTVFIAQSNGTTTTSLVGTAVGATFGESWWHIGLTTEQSGGNVVTKLYVNGSLQDTDTTAGTLAAPLSVSLAGTTATTVNMGHLVIGSGVTLTAAAEAADGHSGEDAHTRIERVCAEEGIAVTITGSESEVLGPQPIDSVLGVCLTAANAGHGILHEPRDSFGLAYRCLHTLENQVPKLGLTYGSKEIGAALDPVEDLDLTQNDVTVTRTGGSSGRSVQETGPRNVQEPVDDPEGVGRYAVEYDLNLHVDDQAVQHASFLRAVGTDPGARYPVIGVDLDSLTAQGKTSLVAAAVSVDLGDRLTIASPPDFAQNDDINLMVQGYTERASLYHRTLEFNATSADPSQVGVYAEDSMTLLQAVTNTGTNFRIASDPPFTTDSADWPVALMVDGEEVSVVSVVNVAVALSNGTPVHGDNASLAPVIPSHVEGDLLLLFAAIRNSGTGTVNTPAGGWSSFVTHGNIEVFWLYATSAATPDPTVVFTGGVAGATTSAVVVRARGCQFNSDAINDKGQLNGSAQDIAYPYYVVEGDVQVFNYSWKQDDYTSVAVGAGGMAEVLEASTTTGDDQSLYIARLSTTVDAFPIVTNSHTVTGGASAISRSVFFTLLRGVVDMTVVRSVNGVVTTHAQGATVEVANPLNLAF